MKKNINNSLFQKNLTTTIIVIVIILLATIGLYFAKENQSKKSYSDSKFGWKIEYAPNWTLNPKPSFDNSTTPSELDIQFQLNHASGCTLTYGKIKTYTSSDGHGSRFDRPGLAFREYVSNIFLGNKNFQLYSLHDENLRSFDDVMGAYIKNFPEKNSPYSLVLFNNNSKLSGSCISDFLSLLKNNIDLKGELYTINPSSNGTVFLQSGEYSLTKVPTPDENINFALIFQDQNGDRQVLQYLNLRDKINSQLNLQLVGNDLYFINSTGQLSTINIISKEVHTVDLLGLNQYSASTRLSNFLIYENNIFYLIGQDCRAHPNKCNLSLYKYSLESKENSLLADGVNSLDIMGYDSISNKLYMNSVINESCSWQEIKEYNFQNKKISGTVSTISYPDCGETDSNTTMPPEKAKVIEIYKKLGNQTIGDRHLKIENGKVVKDPNSDDAPYGSGIRYIGK